MLIKAYRVARHKHTEACVWDAIPARPIIGTKSAFGAGFRPAREGGPQTPRRREAISRLSDMARLAGFSTPRGSNVVKTARFLPCGAGRRKSLEAEGVGFEPTDGLRHLRFSRPSRSTTLAPLLVILAHVHVAKHPQANKMHHQRSRLDGITDQLHRECRLRRRLARRQSPPARSHHSAASRLPPARLRA